MMLYRALRRFTIAKALVGLEPFHIPDGRQITEFHGSSYGGWAIVADSLSADSIVISVGLGQDISFDRSIMEKYGCRIYGFDPTPASLEWIQRTGTDPRMEVHGMALADRDGTLQLSLPDSQNADQVSASAKGLGPSIEVPCGTLKTLLQYTPNEHCDVLKMDIEGCEYEVIAQAVERNWLSEIGQVLVEFHHWMPGIGTAATKQAVVQLRSAGYKIGWISRTNHEYLFVKDVQ